MPDGANRAATRRAPGADGGARVDHRQIIGAETCEGRGGGKRPQPNHAALETRRGTPSGGTGPRPSASRVALPRFTAPVSSPAFSARYG